MSSRNTGIFVSGHIAPDAIADVLWTPHGLNPRDFVGDEAIRAGQGTVDDVSYTLVTARVFAIAGFAMLDRPELPEEADIEMVIGAVLSKAFGTVVFLAYDDERGWGGFARFKNGRCEERQAIDARGTQPVKRTMTGDVVLSGIDESEWIWPDLSRLVEAGAQPVLGPGIQTDDDIEKRVVAAAVSAIPSPIEDEAIPSDASSRGMRDLLKRLVRG